MSKLCQFSSTGLLLCWVMVMRRSDTLMLAEPGTATAEPGDPTTGATGRLRLACAGPLSAAATAAASTPVFSARRARLPRALTVSATGTQVLLSSLNTRR